MNIAGNELRKGMVIQYENKLWVVMVVTHRTPGNLRAFIQTKFRNIRDGSQKDFRFSSTEKLERLSMVERKMQYLYGEGDSFHFMDTENFEQLEISRDVMGDAARYVYPELVIVIGLVEGVPVTINLPQTMEFQVVETDPEIRSATASASYKSAKLSNGLAVQVPQFIRQGDTLKINTETGEYQERVNKK